MLGCQCSVFLYNFSVIRVSVTYYHIQGEAAPNRNRLQCAANFGANVSSSCNQYLLQCINCYLLCIIVSVFTICAILCVFRVVWLVRGRRGKPHVHGERTWRRRRGMRSQREANFMYPWGSQREAIFIYPWRGLLWWWFWGVVENMFLTMNRANIMLKRC